MKKPILLLIFLAISLSSRGQVITTFAGVVGAHTCSGIGGPATAAGIWSPVSVTAGAAGDIFIGSGACYQIFRVDAAGIITLFAGNGITGTGGDGGPATAAGIGVGGHLCADGSGNVYFGDNHCIRKINTAGIINTIAGVGPFAPGYGGDGGPATAAYLNNPRSIFVNSAGEIFFVDAVNYRLRKIDASGIITTIAGTGVAGYRGDGGPATAATLGGGGSVGGGFCRMLRAMSYFLM